MAQVLERLIHLDDQIKRTKGIMYTPQEIAQQPEMWLKTKEVIEQQMRDCQEILAQSEQIVLTGAGSSYFAGVCAEAALASRLKVGVRSTPSTEIVMDPESTLPRSPFTLVSIARSGNSPEGNAAFKLAESLRPGQVSHIVITCNPEGILASLAHETPHRAALCLLPPETDDQGLAMTSSFTSLVVATLGLGFTDDVEAYGRTVGSLAQAGNAVLEQYGDVLEQVAGEGFERVFFLGARPFYGAALESHLKVQEMTDGQVIAKAEDTLGLRHGPMAAINDRSLVVLFGSEAIYRRQYETDLLKEVMAKDLGMLRIVVCGRADTAWRDSSDHVIEFDSHSSLGLTDDVVSPVLVMPSQIMGLFKGMALSLKPDVPSQAGVINRVVEGVAIYPY